MNKLKCKFCENTATRTHKGIVSTNFCEEHLPKILIGNRNGEVIEIILDDYFLVCNTKP